MKAPSAKLMAEWNRKLADSGFHDIEPSTNPDGLLLGNRLRHEHHIATSEESATYYRQAKAFPKHRKLTALERRVWELHADGVPVRDIAQTIGHASQHRAHDIIQRLRAQMMGAQVTDMGGSLGPRKGNKRPRVRSKRWTIAEAVARMDEATFIGMMPVFLSALITTASSTRCSGSSQGTSPSSRPSWPRRPAR